MEARKIFTIKDINRIFTEWVKDYLDSGYTFNLNTSNGTQGEIMKADLTRDNGRSLVRVVLSKFHEPTDKWYCYMDGMVMQVRLFEDVEPWKETLWNDKGIVLLERKFYGLTDQYNLTALTEDKGFAMECFKKRNSRSSNPSLRRKISLTKGIKEKALALVRNKDGFKRTTVDMISEMEFYGNAYYITVEKKGKKNRLYFPMGTSV